MVPTFHLPSILSLGIVILIAIVVTIHTSIALPEDHDQVLSVGSSNGISLDNKEEQSQAYNVTERDPKPRCIPYAICTLSKGCGYGCNCEGNPLTCQPFLTLPAKPEDQPEKIF